MEKHKNKCNDCQGTPVSSDCVVLTTGSFDKLSDFVEAIESKVEVLEAPHDIDVKCLSSNKKLTRDQIIQLLIDKIETLEEDICKLNSRCPATTHASC